MRRSVTFMWTMFVMPSVMLAAAAMQSNTRALIEQALNEPTVITLERIRIGDALGEISKQTGVVVRLDAESAGYLPYGADTMIEKVELANIPLRQGLLELFSPLGMTLAVREDHVAIVPKPALRCLGRKPTWAELDTLGWLASIQPGVNEEERTNLIARTQMRVPVASARDLLRNFLESVGPGPGDEVFSAACDVLGWAWCVDGEHLVVTLKQEQVQRQLERIMSLRMNNRPLVEVLQAVGERLGVRIRTEPGVIGALPASMQRNFSLNVNERSGAEVLEMIAAYTGLGYYIEPDGVAFYPGSAAGRVADASASAGGAAPSGPRGGDPYVAKMVVPIGEGKTVEWLIRRSELPEDLQRMREEDIAAMIESLRARAGVSGN